MKKDARYSCYPFMREKASTVDFEIRTDSLTTHLGVALAAVKKRMFKLLLRIYCLFYLWLIM